VRVDGKEHRGWEVEWLEDRREPAVCEGGVYCLPPLRDCGLKSGMCFSARRKIKKKSIFKQKMHVSGICIFTAKITCGQKLGSGELKM